MTDEGPPTSRLRPSTLGDGRDEGIREAPRSLPERLNVEDDESIARADSTNDPASTRIAHQDRAESSPVQWRASTEVVVGTHGITTS